MFTTDISEPLLRTYPYPIAKCYERLIRTRDATERLDHGRYLFEVTIKYCAAVAISKYVASGLSDAATNQALACLTRPSLGHWINLIRQCLRSTTSSKLALADALFSKRRGQMALTFGALQACVNPDAAKKPESVSAFQLAEMMVTYRNHSIGHGAPLRSELEPLSPVIERGVIEMVQCLDVLSQMSLVYLSNISVHRTRFHHGLTRLMGTAPVAIPDHVTTKEDALLGHDGSLFLMDPTSGTLELSLHPLLIYVSEEVFLLQNTDLRKSVAYLCYHNGRVHQADHVFDDFKDKFARYLDEHPINKSVSEGENIYRACLTMSLVNGVIGPEERAYLNSLATRFGIPEARALDMELETRREMSSEVENAKALAIYSNSATTGAGPDSVTAIAERQDRLLRECGAAVLEHICGRSEPFKPVRIIDLAADLSRTYQPLFGNISPAQLARLLGDIQNHGFAPGLVRTPDGYAVRENHIAFKLNRQKDLKRQIAIHAVGMIAPGARIGLDGGSTTLPIAEELINALDLEMLYDIKLVTNSISVVRRVADFVERRGWSDNECPIQVLVGAGRLRAVTEAIAEPSPGSSITCASIEALIREVGGLDLSFIGCNGITAADGLTMPTEVELDTKKQFLGAAKRAIVVADASKFGVRHRVVIADWHDDFNLLTNRPGEPTPELDAILAVASPGQIVFAAGAGFG